MIHDFEIFLRDQHMFELEHKQTIDVERAIDAEDDEMIEEPGIGYRGTFTVNPKFDVKEAEKVVGYATAEGTAAYAQRSSLVHESNFKKVKVGNTDDPLTLSKMIYGTAGRF